MALRRPAAPLSAFMLHRWDWSETSLILDLFTRESGRVAVAAKGAKRPYSQLRSVLLPFQRIQVQLSRGSEDAEIQTLRTAEWAGGAATLSGAALFSGFYLNELLMKLLARHDPHVRLFDTYAATLPRLALPNEAAVQAALRAFELMLLREIGLLPDLGMETLTLRAAEPERRYALLPEAGVVEAAANGAGGGAGIGGTDLAALKHALAANDVVALARAAERAGPGLRSSLRHLLHYHLGSPTLRTREVMRDVQRLAETHPLRR